jgi:hypothetical protein
METSISYAIATVRVLTDLLSSWAAGEPFDGTTDDVTRTVACAVRIGRRCRSREESRGEHVV